MISSKQEYYSMIEDEVAVTLIIYHLICTTDFVYDSGTRYQVGWSMIGVTLTFLIAKIGRMFLKSTCQMY